MANTRRENRLEELGRVDAERAYTRKGKRNLRDEKHRIRKELKKGGQVHKAVKTIISPVTHVRNLVSARLIKGKPKIAKKGWK
jgi:hypothetical protein